MKLFLDRQEAEALVRYLEPLEEVEPIESDYLKRVKFLRQRCGQYLKHLEEKKDA